MHSHPRDLPHLSHSRSDDFVTPPETTASTILDAMDHDLEAALMTARRHLRSRPEDAAILSELAAALPADRNTSTRFRGFIRDVIADAVAEERWRLANRAAPSCRECA